MSFSAYSQQEVEMWVNVLRESQKVMILKQQPYDPNAEVILGTQSKTLLAES